jgi:hypothetical protein
MPAWPAWTTVDKAVLGRECWRHEPPFRPAISSSAPPVSRRSAGSGAVSRRGFILGGAASAVPASARGAAQAAAAGVHTEAGRALYLADLGACRPASALSRKPRRNHWRLVDFTTEKLAGVMLVAGHNTAAPEIRLPLGRSGWHAVHLGLRSPGGDHGDSEVEVRLSGGRTFARMRLVSAAAERHRVVELFWRDADLTGQELVIRQPRLQTVPESAASAGNASSPVWLAYVKLVPLPAAETARIEAERRSGANRRLFAHHDAWSYTFFNRPTTEEEIRRELEPLRDSDFSRLYWEAGGGERMTYPTRLGSMPDDPAVEDPYRLGDRLAVESWRILKVKGIDPLRVALDYAHELGLEFHATYRPAGFHYPIPEDEWTAGGFYDRHPELRSTDRRGRPTPRLSYAFPEVRGRVIALLEEIARYPVDGVCIAFNRRPPLVEYDRPAIDAFRARHGIDPRSIDERDPRWLAVRAAFLTAFMRELRQALERSTSSRRVPPAVSAIVLGSEVENLDAGLDLPAWLREGLVDTLIPYTSGPGLESSAPSWVDPGAAAYFVRLTRGTRCTLACNLMPRRMAPEEYRRRALGLYRAGVPRLFFWDYDQRCDYGAAWSALRRLGHVGELEAWDAAGSPALPAPGSELKRLGDWDLGYQTPG